jgi:hypothetical protein
MWFRWFDENEQWQICSKEELHSLYELIERCSDFSSTIVFYAVFKNVIDFKS